VQHIPMNVWEQLQLLHDTGSYWSGSELTKDGESVLRKIHNKCKDYEDYEDTNTKHIR